MKNEATIPLKEGKLNVYWDGALVGDIVRQGMGDLRFAYHPKWNVGSQGAISLSLPLSGNFSSSAGHNFFANLLPEGHARNRIETLFKISPGNDFQCLAALGGDCAGALFIGHEAPKKTDFGYKSLSENAILEALKSKIPEALLMHGKGIRLSLAGAQGKIPVRYVNGKFSLPVNGAPTSHILKFKNSEGMFSRLVENEFFIMRLAHHVGLPVAKCELLKLGSETVLMLERYDRELTKEGLVRLHQEDFCQATGISHSAKYESEGGPSFARCVELARKHLTLNEVGLLVDWFLFNVCVGNSDVHGKNLSVIYRRPGKPSLAPFYDLVCTRAYQRVDRSLAMGVGGEFNPDRMTEAHFARFARDIGISAPFLRSRGQNMVERIRSATAAAKADLAAVVRPDTAQQVFLAVAKLTKRHERIFSKV
jgi:serine/threonine-protein kinase HipA